MNHDENGEVVIVPYESAGERLDTFLACLFPEISRSRLQKQIAEGLVTVNGTVSRKSCIVGTGDAVAFDAQKSIIRHSSVVPQEMPLPVLFEDEHLLAIDKPAGLVVHPGNGNRDGTMVSGLLFRNGALSAGSDPDRPGIVHRLDKETSGVIVVAKSDAAHAALAALFASRQVRKIYLGFCIGNPPHSGTIDFALGRSRKQPTKQAADPLGKPSQTDYRVLGSYAGISLVRFEPRTGRTHQIRVHCSSRGFPIVGDVLYGGGRERLLQVAPLDRPFASSVMKCFTRHALHAWSLSLTHPFTKQELTVISPLPEDFKAAQKLFGNRAFPIR
jgi:23S rRNA pseudouridine1911/1915/1917 synthase